jgi:hypothetical protein
VASTIVLSSPQLAPSGFPLIEQGVTAGPPVVDTFASTQPVVAPGDEKNPIHRLSGEKNGWSTKSTPASGRASS